MSLSGQAFDKKTMILVNEGGLYEKTVQKIRCGMCDSGNVCWTAAGCGGSSDSSDGGKKTVSIWFPAYAGTDAEVSDQEFWEEQLAPLEKEENCEFDVQILPWSNYEEKYLSGVTSGNGPDIGYMSMDMMGDIFPKIFLQIWILISMMQKRIIISTMIMEQLMENSMHCRLLLEMRGFL